jgi:hypothetical protein
MGGALATLGFASAKSLEAGEGALTCGALSCFAALLQELAWRSCMQAERGIRTTGPQNEIIFVKSFRGEGFTTS